MKKWKFVKYSLVTTIVIFGLVCSWGSEEQEVDINCYISEHSQLIQCTQTTYRDGEEIATEEISDISRIWGEENCHDGPVGYHGSSNQPVTPAPTYCVFDEIVFETSQGEISIHSNTNYDEFFQNMEDLAAGEIESFSQQVSMRAHPVAQNFRLSLSLTVMAITVIGVVLYFTD